MCMRANDSLHRRARNLDPGQRAWANRTIFKRHLNRIEVLGRVLEWLLAIVSQIQIDYIARRRT